MLEALRKSLAPDQRVLLTIWDEADDSIEHTFTTFIEAVEGLNIRVSPPGPGMAPKVLPLMKLKAVIGAILEVNPSPFIFYPVILKQESNNSFWLKIPEDGKVENIQERRHVRIPMIVPFHVEYPVGSHWISLAARTEDVSGGGLKFNSQRLFPKEQKIVVHLQLSPDLPKMRIEATVVFSHENTRLRRASEDLYTTAVQFCNLEEAQESIIMKECFRRELNMNNRNMR